MVGNFFTDLFPKMLDSYLDTQDSLRKQMEAFSVPTQWMDATKDMKVPVFNTFSSFKSSMETSSKDSPSKSESEEINEVDELKDRLKDLEERLNLMQSNTSRN